MVACRYCGYNNIKPLPGVQALCEMCHRRLPMIDNLTPVTQPAVHEPAVHEPAVHEPAVHQPTMIKPATTQPSTNEPPTQ